MTWDIDKSQPYTVIDIHIPTGLLTVVLASQDEVRHKWLFQEISKKEKMEVIHVLSAADPVAIQYPSKIKLYVCSMYDKNAQTMQTLLRFWDGCLQAARDGEAVVIHSKTGFCRAPLAMAAIAGGSTAIGGAIGKNQAEKEIEDPRRRRRRSSATSDSNA